MYLKALELQGFKSFPDKTRLTFDKDFTAIVGPNGSGKSNISDALMWVMGEQRTKALRGGKMEDVVFGGTEKRSKMGFAQVSLILDNSERFFDSDSTEIMITRRYYRSGESEYYINRQSVRLRDIIELLMDTGLGRYGYSIIGQGRISEIVSAKSTDRRELFEEAAGISRFRSRKDESERKLARTDENLVRINDKIDELKLRVEPLKEQSEKAKKYLLLRDELRILEVSLWMNTLDGLEERSRATVIDWDETQALLEDSRARLSELYSSAENYFEKMREKDLEAESIRIRQSRAAEAAAEKESRRAVLENDLEHNSRRRERLLEELDEQMARVAGLEEQIARRRSRVEDIGRELEVLREESVLLADKAGEYAESADSARKEMNDLFSEKSLITAELSHFDTVLAMLKDAEKDSAAQEEHRSALIAEARERIEILDEESKMRDHELQLAEEELRRGENVLSGHRMRLERQEAQTDKLREEKTALTIRLGETSSRAKMLQEMEREYEGFSKAVKTVMRESRRGVLKGIRGPVAGLVRASERFSLAIETALGSSMQSIVVDTQEQGKAAIELLKRSDSGRATFLPVNTIKPMEAKLVPEGEEGFLGTAFELADFDSAYESIFSSLLARTMVAESLSDAVRIAKKYDNRLRIVTLDGQLINPGGSMTGGSAGKNTGILSRANLLKELLKKKSALEEDMTRCEESLSQMERELGLAKYELQTAELELAGAQETVRNARSEREKVILLAQEAERTLETLKNQEREEIARRKENRDRVQKTLVEKEIVSGKLKDLDNRLEEIIRIDADREQQSEELADLLSALAEKRSSLISERDTTVVSVEQLNELLADITGDEGARRQTLEDLEREEHSLNEEFSGITDELNRLRSEMEEIKKELSDLAAEKMTLEGSRSRADRQAQEENRRLLELERHSASIEQKMLAVEMEEKQIIDKLWDSYELSRSAAQAIRQPFESISAASKKTSSLRRDISALGNPNLGAIEEYEKVKERYDFLTDQRDDVEKAKKELERIIGDITKEMKEIFRREFDAINESFRTTFLELFGGGKAALVLEDEDDILNCGIEIKVQPPGKALTNLSLLSGGETAFVAIALYFAMLKVRPAPFCVMDEIESALDDANVDRFASYLRGLTDKTQFIVITHRRGTMEEADILYGVTMQEKGVSQVFSVDLAEAERTLINQG